MIRVPRSARRVGAMVAIAALVLTGAVSGAVPAGAATASGWTVTNTPNATGTSGGLRSISCVSSSDCVAVGVGGSLQGALEERPLAEYWNGTSWANMPMPSTTAEAAEFNGVACPGAGDCLAVGWSESRSGQALLAESWDGTSWSMVPISPPAGTPAALNGISCASTDFCVAVGSASDALAYVWNGSTFTPQTLPDPSGSTLTGVSCPTTSECVAVGETAYGEPLALGLDDGVWTNLTIAPPPSGGTLQSVDCVTISSCEAVGRQTTSNGTVPLAEGWNGTTWSPQATPAPSSSTLQSVVCTSASDCAAVGASAWSDLHPTTGPALALEWNGSVWTEQSTPASNGPMYGVACPPSGPCIAVGDDPGVVTDPFLPPSEEPAVLGQRGGSWYVHLSRPGYPERIGNELMGVSCSSPSSCVAVGYATDIMTGVPFALIELWNGTSWSLSRYHQAADTTLLQISCATASYCLAVGTQGSNAAQNIPGSPLVEQWNGTTWQVLPAPAGVPDPSESRLSGVSCFAADQCVLVGSYVASPGTLDVPLVELWNGSTWTQESVPSSPSTSSGSYLSTVSCSGSQQCMAVGVTFTPSSRAVFSETWNGSVWTAVDMPAPSQQSDPQSTGVSCPTAGFCLAVGDYEGQTYGPSWSESWNGSAWTVQPLPSSVTTSLDGVSCASPDDCTAVGGAMGGNLVVTWNGATWSPPVYPMPPGAAPELEGVSCPTAGPCLAVGGRDDAATRTLAIISS